MKACILSCAGSYLSADEASLFAEYQPWAIILMGRSCQNRDQLRKLVDDIWAALERPCLIFIDQEGGRVARLGSPEWPVFPSAESYARLYAQNPEEGLEASYIGYRLIAYELAAIGVYANCAPVADLYYPDAHKVIGDRAFGQTPDQVIALANQALSGLQDGGVAPVIKHIPGHGRALVDSHVELPYIDASCDLLADDFSCFSGLNHAPMAMSAHITYTSIDHRAATLSAKLIKNIIRKQIGFDGLLMSDDLGMRALGSTLGNRAKSALDAGCDIVLHCAGFVIDSREVFNQMRQVAEHTKPLQRDALARAENAQSWAHIPKPFDYEAGWNRLNTLMAKISVS